MKKLISIIIPCFNVEQYIDRCFASIEAQTIGIDKLELIFVDDCSQDGTWEKLQAIEAKYSDSVIIVHCDENGRLGRARNIGMSYATAPYIGFVDADDWIEPDMYQIMYECFAEQDYDVVMCQSYRDRGTKDQKLPPRMTGKADQDLRIDTDEKRNIFLACGTLGYVVWDRIYKTSLLRENEIYFPEGIAYEDHYFSILLHLYTKSAYVIEQRLYHYYVNNNSLVLTSNASHHFDMLTADCKWWEECEKRGLIGIYREPLEYQFLCLCYLASFKMMLLRLTYAPYDYFLKLKTETLKRVPDYHKNRCVRELVTNSNKVLLELLDRDITEEQFCEFCGILREQVRKGKIVI